MTGFHDCTEVVVRFSPDGSEVRVDKGSTVREAALAAGVPIYSPCGGEGTCGKCRIRVHPSIAPKPTEPERKLISQEDLDDGVRLACMARVVEDTQIEVLAASAKDGLAHLLVKDGDYSEPLEWDTAATVVSVPEPVETGTSPCSDGEAVGLATGSPLQEQHELGMLRDLPESMRSDDIRGVIQYDNEPIGFIRRGERLCGAAFDVGTTTVVGWLYDLEEGNELAVAAALNPQETCGADAVSRIAFASSRTNGLDELHRSIVGAVNKLITDMCRDAEVPPTTVADCVVVGNTTMMHLFLGISPQYLGLAPHVPVTRGPVRIPASQIGLAISPVGRVYHLPCIGSFVGADTVGVILATGLHRRAGTHLAIDIGTNGEIVLAHGGRLTACSTAAGPAFEGGEISCGMRGVAGAIDRVDLGAAGLDTRSIGDEPARGICGSGILDAVAALLECGAVEPSGRLVVQHREGPVEVINRDGELRAVLARTDSGDVYITQRDIRQVQLAKAAIRVGIETLLDRSDLGSDDLDGVFLAGAFGNYMRPESAVRIGLVPPLPIERFHPVGNAAGAGARLALVSRRFRQEATEVASAAQHVDLMADSGFQNRFVEAMTFPESTGK